MNAYEQKVWDELKTWEREMVRRPSIWNKSTKALQSKVHALIPQKVHTVITASIKQMIKATLVGSEYTTKKKPRMGLELEKRDQMLTERVKFYKRTAALEGAGTGAGGFLLGLADFPLLLGIKMKFLFEAAVIYGFDVTQKKERVFILHVFQLAFASPIKRKDIFHKIIHWEETKKRFPQHPSYLEGLDWQGIQQDYRDHIDLAKFLQMVPGIGAAVGAFANYNFLDVLGMTAMRCYQWRILLEQMEHIEKK